MDDECGVYFLFRKRQLTYVGRSKNPERRIQAHRRNGRPFDHSLFVQCDAADVAWVEKALIEALNPPQNRLGVTSPREERAEPVVQIIRERAPAYTLLPPDPASTMPMVAARREAEKYHFHREFEADVRSGVLRSAPRNPALDGPGRRRIITRGDLDAWIAMRVAERDRSGFRVANLG